MATALRFGGTRPMLRRLFWILEQLKRGRRITATVIASELEVTVRTAYRDVDHLRDVFRAPIDFDSVAQSYVLREPSFALPVLTLSRGELLAFAFAEQAVRQYRGTPYAAELEHAVRRLQALLPDEVHVDGASLEGLISLELGPVAVPDPDVFACVVDALVQRRRLRMTYTTASRGATESRTIEPYRVYNARGDWYVAAFDDRRRAVRDFALHRIRAPELLKTPFEPPEGFDFEAYKAAALGVEKGGRATQVAIRFSPLQARWIREKRWHASARIQEELGGGCVLRMRVAGLDEVRRWVMQFGAEAEVLAPRALRDAVAQSLEAAAEIYRGRRAAAGARRVRARGAVRR